MIKLHALHAREVLDSRGNPTVEVIASSEKHRASAMVPSGASTGAHEAVELRDGDKKRYGGKGVLKAVGHVEEDIWKALRGADIENQKALDRALIDLDGTENKSKLGANAILGASLACAKLAARHQGLHLFEYLAALGGRKTPNLLPVPFMNVINGGRHADSGLEFQEMMIVPAGAPNFTEALRMGAEIFHSLKSLLQKENFSIAVGDEGGFAPRLRSHEAALDLLIGAIEKSGYRPAGDVFLALDTAASEFFNKERYEVKQAGQKKELIREKMVEYYEDLCRDYPIISLEDGCAEDDWEGWKMLTERLGGRCQLVGDDLFVTNRKRLEEGIAKKVADAILIKLNQIGTLSETLEVMLRAREAGYARMVSHRSGETEDTTIAHLAVGMETGQIKTGSLCRSERISKYNELLRIEEYLGAKATFAGPSVRRV